MFVVWLVIGGLILAFAGSLIMSAFRWLARIALACLMAECAGLLATVFAPTDVTESWAIPLIVLTVFVVSVFALARLPHRNAASTTARMPLPTPGPVRSRRARPKLNPWDQLVEAAPDSSARIAVARRSCERLASVSKGRLLDMRAHESRIMLEKHVPEYIRRELNRSEGLSSAQSERLLRELVEFLERVAANCERRLDGWKPGSDETDDILRRHIQTYLDMKAGHPIAS
jgi:hypothetical protein